MKKYERKLQKYNKLVEKYEEKVRKIAQKFTEEVCKAIGAEQLFIDTSKEYTHIIYNNIKFQSGSHDLYFYSGSLPNLQECLEKQVELEKKK